MVEIKIVAVNEFVGEQVEKKCTLCGTSFFEAEDPYEPGQAIIVAPCKCYNCCEEGQEDLWVPYEPEDYL